MPDWRASFWVNHCAEQNSSQMPGVCTPHPAGGGGGWGGCFGIKRYTIKYKEKNLDIPNLIRATIICPLAFRFIVVQLYMHWPSLFDRHGPIFCVFIDRHKVEVNDSRPPPPPPSLPKKTIMNKDDRSRSNRLLGWWRIVLYLQTLNRQKYILFKISVSLKMSQISASIF